MKKTTITCDGCDTEMDLPAKWRFGHGLYELRPLERDGQPAASAWHLCLECWEAVWLSLAARKEKHDASKDTIRSSGADS